MLQNIHELLAVVRQRYVPGPYDPKAHIRHVADQRQRHQPVIAVAVRQYAAAGGNAVRVGHDIVGRGAVADGHYPVKLRAGAYYRLLGEVVVAV